MKIEVAPNIFIDGDFVTYAKRHSVEMAMIHSMAPAAMFARLLQAYSKNVPPSNVEIETAQKSSMST